MSPDVIGRELSFSIGRNYVEECNVAFTAFAGVLETGYPEPNRLSAPVDRSVAHWGYCNQWRRPFWDQGSYQITLLQEVVAL